MEGLEQDRLKLSQAKPSSLVWHAKNLKLVKGVIFGYVREQSSLTGIIKRPGLQHLHLDDFRLNLVTKTSLHLDRHRFWENLDEYAQ
jgi:hypothetical protein